MNLREITRRYLGWCPGYDSAEKFIADRNIGIKTLAVYFMVFLLTVVVAYPFEPYISQAYIRFLVIALMAFIGVPLMWRILREEKSGDQEGSYPEPSGETPSEKFGEFNLDSPAAEAPMFGPSRSSADYNVEYLMNREWLHPDILWYKRRTLKDKEEKQGNK
jgi:hypothetical protein